ncbi:MAG: zf-HC2 domain-containing protein [Eubacteriales bacterium]|nr:zf-HC2 domain-containing protein [Eubacteriales bacterium]
MNCKETQSLVMDYLNRELGGEILDDFLHHIRGCRECYEELEIYYIIHFAMQRLDSEELVSYDIKGMLEEDLREAERTVRKWKLKRSWQYGFILIAELLLCFIIFTQIQNLKFGGIEETWLYGFLFNG